MCQLLSRVQLFAVSWTVSRQVPLSMEFSRQEYWSGLPFPSPGDLPDPGIEPGSPALQADSLPFEPPGNPPSQARDGTQVSRIAGVFFYQLSHQEAIIRVNGFNYEKLTGVLYWQKKCFSIF